jgi:hypothetical protein
LRANNCHQMTSDKVRLHISRFQIYSKV